MMPTITPGNTPSSSVAAAGIARTASVAAVLRKRALGVILTGMGSDGAKGLMLMRSAGAHTLGEAEKSCTIYGMPKAAMRLGAVAEELDVDGLAERLRGLCAGDHTVPETT